jgi:hypothetical protein
MSLSVGQIELMWVRNGPLGFGGKFSVLKIKKNRKTTNQITRRLQTFVNKYLRRIMKIKWFDRITNEDLWSITQQEATENQIKRRNWNWIGHRLRKEAGAIERKFH